MSLEGKEDEIRSEFIRKWESSNDHVRLLFNFEMDKIKSFLDRRGYLEDIIKSHSETSINFLIDEKKKYRNLYFKMIISLIVYILLITQSDNINYTILLSSIYVSVFILLNMKYYVIFRQVNYIRTKRSESEDELNYYKEIVYSELPKFYSKEEILSNFHDIESEIKVYNHLVIGKYEYFIKKLDDCHEKMNDWSSH